MISNAAWDPNFIPELLGELEPCRIYADDNAQICAVVDYVDYQWAIQWKWSIKISKGGNHIYLRRMVDVKLGVGRRNRVQQPVYLHIEIMKRTGIQPPTPKHTIVDHRNSDPLNCRRSNLRWLTPSMNSKNKNGKYAHVSIF